MFQFSSRGRSKVFNHQFTYRVEKYVDGVLELTRDNHAYAMNAKGAEKAIAYWNKLGARPSEVGGITYKYRLLP